MKKLVSGLVLACMSLPAFALDATPLFSVYAGAGNWSAEYEGKLGSGDQNADFDDLGYDDESNVYFYVAFEHAVPVIPNVRLERIDLSVSGEGAVSTRFLVDDQAFEVGTDVSSDLDLVFTDATLYYELLMVDFGVTLRQFDAELQVASATESAREEVDGVLPMVYLQAKIPFPTTGLYIAGSANALSYDDKSITDYRVSVGYDIELVAVEIGLEIGYRGFELDLGDEEDVTGDIELGGAFFGANIKF